MSIQQRFPRRRVLITGGASGLGRAVGRCFAARGWRVAFTDLDDARIEEAAAELRALGASPLHFAADASDERAWRRVEAGVVGAWGGLDILVNNAGVGSSGEFADVPLTEWDNVLCVNLRGPIVGAHVFAPHFIRQGAGHIVNVASSAGIASLPGMAAYNVSKGGLISFSESLRIELARHNVGVTCVAPTFFRSRLAENAYATDAARKQRGIDTLRRAKVGADQVARDLMRALDDGRFYVMTQADGRFVWSLKRLMPEAYLKTIARLHRTGALDRFI